jgi:hypothetical protein
VKEFLNYPPSRPKTIQETLPTPCKVFAWNYWKAMVMFNVFMYKRERVLHHIDSILVLHWNPNILWMLFISWVWALVTYIYSTS